MDKTIFRAEEFIQEDGYKLLYRLYIPADYDETKAYPLVLFMHGAGERGDDNISQLRIGIMEMFKYPDSPIHNCIIVAPQCPKDKKWVGVQWPKCIYSVEELEQTKEIDAVLALLADVQTRYHIDSDRIHVTGISMGGYATWDLITRHGDLFASAVPLCGGCDVSKAAALAKIPIWTFHGALDDTVLPTGTRAMAEAIIREGGTKFRYTELSDKSHNIWTDVYSIEEMPKWLLSHKRSDR